MLIALIIGTIAGLAIGALVATVYWLKGIGDSIGRHF